MLSADGRIRFLCPRRITVRSQIHAFIGVRSMYESYFGLREAPFNLTPNPGCFFVNSSYQETVSTLCYGIQRRAGVIVITGEAGTGKTTLLKTFVGKAASNTHASCILDPHLNFSEILLCTSDVFGLSDLAPDQWTITDQLKRFLIEQLKRDHFAALLLDEAQGLDDEVLDELGYLSDLEVGGQKLLQIVLFGQPELESRLERSSLRPITQRVTVRSRLAPLSCDDIQAYIEFRLSAAGYAGTTVFAADAVERIGFYSKGVPRLINVICDNALLVAWAKCRKVVDRETIEEVADELQFREIDLAGPESTLAEGSRLEVPEEAGQYAMVSGKPESQSGDCWVVSSEQIPGNGTEPLPADNRGEMRWATLAIACVLLIAILGGGTLLFLPQGHRTYLSPVTDNFQKLKEFWAPFRGRIDRAAGADTERLQDPAPSTQTEKGSPKKIASARRDVLIRTKQKAQDTGSAKAPEIVQRPSGKNQSTRSTKPPAPQKKFKVVRNSLVRDKPSSAARIVATLHPGTEVQLVRRIGDYLQVRSMRKGAVRGYVHVEDAFFKPSILRVSRTY
jgi:general secretion pathway protein A